MSPLKSIVQSVKQFLRLCLHSTCDCLILGSFSWSAFSSSRQSLGYVLIAAFFKKYIFSCNRNPTEADYSRFIFYQHRQRQIEQLVALPTVFNANGL